MTIRNLTGTTWYFNSTLAQGDFYKDLTFVCNGQTYDTIFRYKAQTSWGNEDEFEYFGSVDVTAYKDGAWRNQAYRTITITGGDDVADTTVINWIKANATYLGVADTTWTFNKQIITDFSVLTSWSINFRDSEYQLGYPWTSLSTSYSPLFYQANIMQYEDTDYNSFTVYVEPNWVEKEYRIITIHDGNDITSETLLTFLQTNAVYGVQSLSPTIYMKAGNTWKEGEGKIKVNNAWKDIDSIHIKQNNTWTEI